MSIEPFDTSLIKIVHQEQFGSYMIVANITRFGGLLVIVYDEELELLYDCKNIVNARMWCIRQQLQKHPDVVQLREMRK